MSSSTLTLTITLKSKDTPFRKYLEGCCENKIPIDNSVYSQFCYWLLRFQDSKLVPETELKTINWKSVSKQDFNNFGAIERTLTFSKQFVDGIVIERTIEEIRLANTHLFLEKEASTFERWVEDYRIDFELNLGDNFLQPKFPLVKVEATPDKFHTRLPTDTKHSELLPNADFDIVSVSRVKGAKELDKKTLESLQAHINRHSAKEETLLSEGTPIKFTRALANYCELNDVGCTLILTGKLPNEYWVKNNKSVRKFSAVLNEDFEVIYSTLEEKESLQLLSNGTLQPGTLIRFCRDSEWYYVGEVGRISEAIINPVYEGNYKIQTNIKGNIVLAHYPTDFEVVKETK